MNRLLLCFTLLAAAAPGCKGEVKVQDRPETLDELAAARQAIRDKDALIKQLNARIAEGNEVVISMEGPEENGEPGAIVEIRAGGGGGSGGGGGGGGSSAADTELYEAFIKRISGSRGSMQKCYESALKKRSDLQAQPVTINIQVDYRTSGEVSGASFSPRISDDFNRCMRSIAGRWTLPRMPRVASFNYRSRLVPR
jgi:hypothetical protein